MAVVWSRFYPNICLEGLKMSIPKKRSPEWNMLCREIALIWMSWFHSKRTLTINCLWGCVMLLSHLISKPLFKIPHHLAFHIKSCTWTTDCYYWTHKILVTFNRYFAIIKKEYSKTCDQLIVTHLNATCIGYQVLLQHLMHMHWHQ